MTLDSANQMVTQAAAQAAPPSSKVSWRPVLRAALGQVVLIGVLLVAAGRLDWWRGWLYAGMIVVMLLVNMRIVSRRNPQLINERWKERPDTKGFDKILVSAYTLALMVMVVVAGLDAGRYGWSTMPPALLWVGVAGFVLGDVPVVLALAENPHLETTVRIQTDRGHRVVTTGPYHVVRHPMYSGLIVSLASWPLVLGSAWAYVPLALVIALLVVRTALEDRTLRRELPGYEDYARTTRYRLVPGIW
jgi:protein-S-isoprenylcysteine O-methyltransferase Ste14